ncbi:hypothetical protein FHS28_004431 [Roseateles terrae]|uniref:Uncharacterized protein n=1 Tax=Roseateles terrae TaxID=431060 RepID=A0ABR6GY22_9BURK|nr:hypothetical protein [Roseateles terrae]
MKDRLGIVLVAAVLAGFLAAVVLFVLFGAPQRFVGALLLAVGAFAILAARSVAQARRKAIRVTALGTRHSRREQSAPYNHHPLGRRCGCHRCSLHRRAVSTQPKLSVNRTCLTARRLPPTLNDSVRALTSRWPAACRPGCAIRATIFAPQKASLAPLDLPDPCGEFPRLPPRSAFERRNVEDYMSEDMYRQSKKYQRCHPARSPLRHTRQGEKRSLRRCPPPRERVGHGHDASPLQTQSGRRALLCS